MNKMILIAVVSLVVAGARASSVEKLSGYRSLDGCSVEFSTEAQASGLAATLTRVELNEGVTQAEIPAVLAHSDAYGDLSVAAVGDGTFGECAALRELVLPKSVTNLADGVFATCTALEAVTFRGQPPDGLAEAGLDPDTVLYFDGKYAAQWLAAVKACGFANACEIGKTPDQAVETIYTVEFKAGTGVPSSGATMPTAMSYWDRGSAWTLEKPTYESEDTTFDGWKFGDTDYVAMEIPAGTNGNLTLTATWKTAQTFSVRTNGAAAASAAVKITQDWIEDNGLSGKSATEVQTALNATEQNGLAKWQNYVIGLDPTNDVVKSAEQDDNEKKVTIVPNAVPPKVDTGYTVRYSIDQVDTNGTVVAAGEETSAENLGIDLDDVASNAVFRMNVVVRKDGDASAAATVVSTNLLGVLKVTQAPKAALVGVPWNDLDGKDVKVSGFVKTASLTEDDELRIYQTNGTYSTWRLKADKTWTSMDENAKSADEETIPRGSAVWLIRQDTSKPIVLFGQVSEAKAETVLDEKKESGKPSWNVVAAPSVTPLDLDAKFTSGVTDDKVIVPTDGAPKTYTYKNGSWGYQDAVAITNSYGEVFSKSVRVTGDAKVPAGTGFWYLNGGSGKKNVEW